jgi:hypothetical protein
LRAAWSARPPRGWHHRPLRPSARQVPGWLPLAGAQAVPSSRTVATSSRPLLPPAINAVASAGRVGRCWPGRGHVPPSASR